ncbi:hypothetical protein M427DRAFT_34295 [Gonapodya prolifera JEL478]|uniref:FAS1 domain-containing protein n=1 Tax=Gonapodya prolifera (strain JEL478) TaxID=1344416 RepID=A0A139A8C6_GONPJ|nr:hypothetical protein M427DRAFT_34295 [Gonapodya prolifera JEL478]|eukprot:KXS13061.1 hypothetical protein M427DRAFT_34295 [Gonapodya prolifera JEL478]
MAVAPIVDVLQSNSGTIVVRRSFTGITKLLQGAPATKQYDTTIPLTILLPSDGAVDKISKAVLFLSTDTISSFVAYHVIARGGPHYSRPAALWKQPTEKTSPVSSHVHMHVPTYFQLKRTTPVLPLPTKVVTNATTGSFTINDVPVVSSIILYNGVAHILDLVLTPPSLAQLMSGNATDTGTAAPTTAAAAVAFPGPTLAPNGPNTAAIAGGAVGGVAALAVIVGGGYFVVKMRKSTTSPLPPTLPKTVEPTNTTNSPEPPLGNGTTKPDATGGTATGGGSTRGLSQSVTPHWFFTVTAAKLGQLQEPSVPYPRVPTSVVIQVGTLERDKMRLEMGKRVQLKLVFRDGWGLGRNINTGVTGMFDCVVQTSVGRLSRTRTARVESRGTRMDSYSLDVRGPLSPLPSSGSSTAFSDTLGPGPGDS